MSRNISKNHLSDLVFYHVVSRNIQCLTTPYGNQGRRPISSLFQVWDGHQSELAVAKFRYCIKSGL